MIAQKAINITSTQNHRINAGVIKTMGLSKSKKQIYMINDIAVNVKKNSHTRFLRLKVDPITKSPVLIVPSICSPKTIQTFLKDSHNAIIEKLKELSVKAGELETIPFKGQDYRIQTAGCAPCRQALLTIDETNKILTLRKPLGTANRNLKTALRNEALSIFNTLCRDYAQTIGAALKEVKVRDYKTRWGSCAHDGTITMSWRLIMAPQAVIEYVCAHETSHLLHFNHSKAFWTAVRSLTPHYKQAHLWLKNQGYSLYQQI